MQSTVKMKLDLIHSIFAYTWNLNDAMYVILRPQGCCIHIKESSNVTGAAEAAGWVTRAAHAAGAAGAARLAGGAAGATHAAWLVADVASAAHATQATW